MTLQPTAPAVVPLSSGHAVQNVVFICEFASTLSSQDLDAIQALYNSNNDLKTLLPIQRVHRGATFTINAADGNINPQPADGNPIGLTYVRMTANGQPEWQVSIDSNRVIIVCGSYTRWLPVFQSVTQFFALFLGAINERIIASAALQYTDWFEVFPGEGNSIASAIFDPDNDYLNKVVKSALEPWHTHLGWFETRQDSPRILVNLNINTVPAANLGFWRVSLTHMQKVNFTKQVNLSDFSQVVKPLFENLHHLNKEMLNQILNDEVCNMISLNNSPG